MKPSPMSDLTECVVGFLGGGVEEGMYNNPWSTRSFMTVRRKGAGRGAWKEKGVGTWSLKVCCHVTHCMLC